MRWGRRDGCGDGAHLALAESPPLELVRSLGHRLAPPNLVQPQLRSEYQQHEFQWMVGRLGGCGWRRLTLFGSIESNSILVVTFSLGSPPLGPFAPNSGDLEAAFRRRRPPPARLDFERVFSGLCSLSAKPSPWPSPWPSRLVDIRSERSPIPGSAELDRPTGVPPAAVATVTHSEAAWVGVVRTSRQRSVLLPPAPGSADLPSGLAVQVRQASDAGWTLEEVSNPRLLVPAVADGRGPAWSGTQTWDTS